MAKSDVKIRIVVDGDKAVSEYKNVQKEIQKANKKTGQSQKKLADESEKSSKKIVRGFNAQKTAVIALSGFITGRLSQSLIRTQKDIDRITNALKVGTGTTEGAAREFKFLEQESNRLGLDLQSTALSYAQLTAAAKNTNLSMGDQREIFIGVSEAGAALGLSAADMEGALRAVQQMISKGNVQAEELRGQLGERIPGAFSIAAKSMGVTEKEMNKLLETGKVTAEDMLPKFAAELRKTFGATAAQGPETLNGKINNLKNTMFKLQRQILEGGGAEMLKDGFTVAAKAVELFGEHMEKVSVGFVGALAVMNPPMAALAGAVLVVLNRMKALDEHVKKIGGLELSDPKNNKRLKEALETMIKLEGTAKRNQQRAKTARRGTAGLFSKKEREDLEKFNAAEKTAIEIIGEGFKNSKASLQDWLKGISAAQVKFDKLAKTEEKRKKKKPPPEEEKKAKVNQVDFAAIKAASDRRRKAIKDGFESEKMEVSRNAIELEEIRVRMMEEGLEKELVLKSLAFQKEKLELGNNHKAVEALEEAHQAEMSRLQQGGLKKREEEEKEAAEKRKQLIYQGISVAISGATQITNAFGNLAAIRGENELKAAEAAGQSEEQIQAIRKKTFEKQKKFQKAGAVMNIAQGVTAGFAKGLPFGPVEAAIVTAAGLVQLQAIDAQKFAQGGVVQGQRTGDKVPILANGGERMLTATQNKAFESGMTGNQTITFSAPVINIENGDPEVVRKAVNETMQEQIARFGETQRDASIHEILS